jgi:quercetin dioxygenase-like cupin family protein
MEQRIHGKVDKGWGFEIVFSNTEKYCGKILVFHKKGSKTSMIMHKEKDKSWFVNSGQFRVLLIDTQTSQLQEKILNEGDVCRCLPMKPHQLEALVDGSMIFEVSNSEVENDDFRIAPGDSQKNNA